MKQNQAMPDYVNQFGPFWFEIFRKLGLKSRSELVLRVATETGRR